MSAAATVLSFRYNRPRACCPINPAASKAMQEAQMHIDDGLVRAEGEMRSAGYDADTAKHLARMAVLQFMSAFHGEAIEAGATLNALVDRLHREGWTKRVGGGLL